MVFSVRVSVVLNHRAISFDASVVFINKLPTEEFEGEARAVVGTYGLIETYGVISGPVTSTAGATRPPGKR